MIELLNFKNSKDVIMSKRQYIKEKLIEKSLHIDKENFSEINNSDLEILFGLYNSIFLSNIIDEKEQISVKFSKRLKSSGGITKAYETKNGNYYRFDISINISMIFRYSYEGENREACGIKIKSSLDALLIIFEHELCHVLEFLCYKSSNCKKDRFKKMANNIFGHNGSTHGLLTISEKLKKEYGFIVGDLVSFEYEGQMLTGQIHRITKRATVFVENENGIFINSNNKKRYNKYLIPLSFLNKE